MTQSSLSTSLTALPEPDSEAKKTSNQLVTNIRGKINAAEGGIGFDKFMQACLYEPGLGYYSAGSRKFGEQGDFVTAPEISSLFSKCLANQCAQVINKIGTGIILELGAGSGVMARDILVQLEQLGSLPKEYWILEVSADLKQRQQDLFRESLPHMFEQIKWLDQLPSNKFDGIILANEVLDALPVCRFEKDKNQFQELKVGYENNKFVWLKQNAGTTLTEIINDLETRLKNPLPENYVSEINTNLQQWLTSIEASLRRGVMLFIDYGYTEAEYYHASRSNGSLLCHYRHHVHDDPFFYPGLQDITASVNFTAMAECAHSLSLNVAGYTSQMYFLLACGLEELVADINEQDKQLQIKVAQQMRKLTLPDEMGERFKVIALTKNYADELMGFSIMDQRVRL